MLKNCVAFTSIYLLTSEMCCNLLRGIATCFFFVKITHILFSGLRSTLYNTTFFTNRPISL